MAKSQTHKAHSRRAILDSAAKLFRERGIDQVSIAEIMDGAGLTHGGFPRHFASKQELVTEVVKDFFAPDRPPVLPSENVLEFAKAYLQPGHRDAPGLGCLVAALAPEMARSSDGTREALTDAMVAQITEFSHSSTGSTDAEKRIRAIGNWATMIGAMQLARIATTKELSDEILRSAYAYIKGHQ